MSLLTPDSGLLFWMIVSFGIVFVILSKYGFPRDRQGNRTTESLH